MKKLLITFILVFVCVNLNYAQTIDDLVKGPIPGYTCTPDAGKFGISTELVSISTKTMFNNDGDEISIKELYEGLADPKISIIALSLTGEYSLNNNIGFFASIPFILKQKWEMNPLSGYEEVFTDKNGETGLGDMLIGGWIFPFKRQKIQVMAHGFVNLPTGSSPDDIGKNNASSTGSGHSSFGVGVSADFIAAPKMLISAGGGFTINNEASFSSEGNSWDEKDGNRIRLWGRPSYKVLPYLSIGLDFEYLLEGETKVNGVSVNNSDFYFLNIMPMVGYQLCSGPNIINITGGYLLHIKGKNFPKFNGFLLGAWIYL